MAQNNGSMKEAVKTAEEIAEEVVEQAQTAILDQDTVVAFKLQHILLALAAFAIVYYLFKRLTD